VLAKLLRVADEKAPDFDTTDVYTESYTATFAGGDTTAIVMRTIVYHLSRNPAARAKLQAEIDAAQTGGWLSANITYAQALRLPYLIAVVKEAMRAHPSIGLTSSRHVPASGRELCGHFLRAGCRVGVNPYVLHCEKTIFGTGADDFNPDRWFRADAATMDRYMFQFGAGACTCIGKNIAMAEIHRLVPQFFRASDVELVDSGREWVEHNTWFVKQTGIEVKPTKRTTSA